jgi:aryl-alcohol dehydrogenase-like predicted oxidoreductase
MGLEKVDIYYVHNPEAQLGAVTREELRRRLRASFETLERLVGENRLSYYGTATWNGYRTEPGGKDYLSLSEVIDLAIEVAGEAHHCRFIQAPYNLGMTEVFTLPNQPVGEETVSLCQAADALGVYLIGSATIAQGRLTQGLPDWLGTLFKGLSTDAQRSLQFARSTPGLTTALVGMKSVEHVRENLETARVPPASVEAFLKLFEVEE